MAIINQIEIDGRMVAFNASAAVPRIYRARFGRDLFTDLTVLMACLNENEEATSEMSIESLEMFENIAYTMAKQADPGAPETPEEWLDQFNFFSIYNILPQIVEMWKAGLETTSESKKKPKDVPNAQ